jgi:hypothetical protein
MSLHNVQTTVATTATNVPAGAEQRLLDLQVQKAVDEALAWHIDHRPSNTRKNYAPKQKEWRASDIDIAEVFMCKLTDSRLGLVCAQRLPARRSVSAGRLGG